ncbi:zinc finger protein CONSTANS-LIKE 3-like [Canna indica]|uniref:Zinc finger protein CONSTANS-LIKE 3-like n=1 Tax=Canna indica TaxID=4628 RepID=A0AAQ3L7B1_9LILI|nr:zinc finger protein CONSTANS-LIKE 3-like [Canna indica]
MRSEAVGKGGYWAGLAARRCDSCKAAAALLYCRADVAYLCGGCDARVHEASQLSSPHQRIWVCEVCEQAPAAVTCKADAAALCEACDVDIHSANPLARRHERTPIVPFIELLSANHLKPSAAAAAGFPFGEGTAPDDLKNGEEKEVEAAAASWLLPNNGHTQLKGLMGAPELKSADFFFSDVDPYLDLEYATSIDTRFQTDSIVPVHAKAAGVDGGVPPFPSFLPLDTGIELDFAPSKLSYSSNNTTNSMSQSDQVSSSEAGVVPDGSSSAMTDVTNPYGGKAATQMDREARVMRYREKRKNRRFEKTIRYASRKAYAETRPRIKGRFAKREDIEAEVDRIYSSAAAAAAALLADVGYGVVPSY